MGKKELKLEWGILEEFNCPEKYIENIKLELSDANQRIVKEVKSFNPDRLQFNQTDMFCFDWNINIEIKLKFEVLKQEKKFISFKKTAYSNLI